MHPVHVHHPQSLRAAHTAASIRLNFRHFFAPLTSRLTDNNKYFPLPPFTLVDIAKFSFFHSRSPGKTYFFFNKVDTNDTLNQTKQRFFTGILRYLTASCYEEHLFLLNLHSLFKKLYGLIKKKKKKNCVFFRLVAISTIVQIFAKSYAILYLVDFSLWTEKNFLL